MAPSNDTYIPATKPPLAVRDFYVQQPNAHVQ